MADKTGIEWTDATWNPIVGCSLASPGCTNCYAMSMAARIEAMQPTSHYAGTTKKVKGNAVWTGTMALAPDHILMQPLKWKRPRKIFVNSMGDLFHESVPDEWIDKVFAVIALCPQHTFQVLTKRSKRMREYFATNFMRADVILEARKIAVKNLLTVDISTSHVTFDDSRKEWSMPKILPNVWLGVSAEDQTRADERIPDLLATPAAVRFVSAEPLLGPIDFRKYAPPHHQKHDRKLDWIICGGESGPKARPMHPDWARSIRDQCAASRTTFFFKQWGEWAWASDDHNFASAANHASLVYGVRVKLEHHSDGLTAARVGKTKAGNLLDNKTHTQFPEVKS